MKKKKICCSSQCIRKKSHKHFFCHFTTQDVLEIRTFKTHKCIGKCWNTLLLSSASQWIGWYKSPSTLALSRLVVPSIHIKRWKSVLRQALINFPFYFVFNRDLVSHAIATDLNSPLFKSRSPKSCSWVKRATITNVTFETVTKLWRIESVCFRLQIFDRERFSRTVL